MFSENYLHPNQAGAVADDILAILKKTVKTICDKKGFVMFFVTL